MTENVTHAPVDKSTWPDGPWMSEPDRIEWEHAGRPCLMVRHPRSGHWCGYAAVDPGHPLHGEDYDSQKFYVEPEGERETWDTVASAHGGLTYCGVCRGDVCHVAKPGEPDDVWWFGFDCAHAGDLSPGYMEKYREWGLGLSDYETYKDAAYVQAETNELAEALAAVGS